MNTTKLKRRLLLRQACGTAIRTAREHRGLTQLALAHKIGYSGDDAGAKVSRIETGAQEPRLDVLTRISKALGVPLSKLINEK